MTSMADSLVTTESTDEQLVRAALSGEASAFGVLVERHWNMVLALGLSRLGDPAEADDIAQESFLKAYSHLPRLRQPARFAGWLSKIVLQECTNMIRRKMRQRAATRNVATLAEPWQTMPAYSSNPGLSENQICFVRQTVSELPEKSQRLIVMRFVAGMSAVQIAEQLGKRPSTVRVWLHRAYKTLRKDLAPLLEEVQS
jgi:RNA polymerase sigma-70 factor (ECF subfamily)